MRRHGYSLSVCGVFAVFLATFHLVSARAQDQGKPVQDKMPKKVVEALTAKFPHAQINKWTREKEGGTFLYDIEFRQEGQKFEADITEDGTIHNWEKAIAVKDLPAAVRQVLERKYPGSSPYEAMEVTGVKSGKDELEGYEIGLKTARGKNFEVTVAPNGKILEESGAEK